MTMFKVDLTKMKKAYTQSTRSCGMDEFKSLG